MTSNITPAAGSDAPSNIQDQFLTDLNNYIADLAEQEDGKATLKADLENMVALLNSGHPEEAFMCISKVLNDVQDGSNSKSLLFEDRMNMNTDIRNFEASALSDLNKTTTISADQFHDMISFLQDATRDIMQHPEVFNGSGGTGGNQIVDQINDFASQFAGNHGGVNPTIFGINSSDYEYFIKNIGVDPSVPSPMFTSQSQDMATVNQLTTSISAKFQTELTFNANILTQEETMYKAVLKSLNDMLQQVNKMSAQ